jgi:murein DD-endopeptidase MepM/ murein hydrolase activator NlpD
MKTICTIVLSLLYCVFSQSIFSQSPNIGSNPEGSGLFTDDNAADNPCITAQQYEMLDLQCAENIKILGLDKKEKTTLTTLFNWPLQAASGFTDCSYYFVSAYVDQNTAAGATGDYNCGTNTYDGHKGTDIAIWPFGFYKMDHSQVEVIAAAAGTIIAKQDGHFDRNCSTNTDTANNVIIQHADGSCALYWHMKSGAVTTKTVGQTVSQGEYLGVVGSSGSSSGPHLHFEVWSGTTSSTYKDPFSGTCNTLNANSWWSAQKPYTEPSILKASVHTTDAKMPGCDTTETPNESTSYIVPFQGQGLPPGYAKFYIFIRNATVGMSANVSILNPGGSVFNSWTYNSTANYRASYWSWSKLLPTTPGIYTFQATYNGITCAQNFTILTTTSSNAELSQEKISVYPNPAYDMINVSFEGIEKGDYSFILRNVIGQCIFKENASYTDGAFLKYFSISTLPGGIYFLTIEGNMGSIVKKIIKEDQN